MSIKKIAGVLALSLVTAMPMLPQLATAQYTQDQTREAIAFRQETYARSIGTMAYVFAYPIVDYYRVMYEQTTEGKDPAGAFAPVNRFFSYKSLTKPHGPLAGRSPNAETVYFQSWLDLTNGPLIIRAPDTKGRYYNLNYVDFYSETIAHTGKRTTGTQSQNVLLVGPDWKGKVPKGMYLVRMPTHKGVILGRILIKNDNELNDVNKLIDQFTIEEAPGTRPAEKALYTPRDVEKTLDFFRYTNIFLKNTPIKPGEQAMMDKFDDIGFGPNSDFDASKLSEATRKGLLAAIADGERLVKEGRSLMITGWAPLDSKIGVYGTDYHSRAAIEYIGLLANEPQEALYSRYRMTPDGQRLESANKYRVVIPPNMPVDAFWALTAYGAKTMDLIPNEAGIYAVGNRDKGKLKLQPDGSAVILMQREKPTEKNVNWLPTGEEAFYVIMRLYNPQPVIFSDKFSLPEIEKLD